MEEEQYVKTESTEKKSLLNYLRQRWVVLLIAIMAIVLIAFGITRITGAKTRAIKQYIAGINSKSVSKMVNAIDFAGATAWEYYYLPNDDEEMEEEDYEDFIENYKEQDKEEIKEAKQDALEYCEEYLEEIVDEYKTYKISIIKIKEIRKIAKDINVIKVRVRLTAIPRDKNEDEEINSRTLNFVTYKNKLIYTSI